MSKRIVYAGIYLLFLLVLMEGASRVYLCRKLGASFFRTSDMMLKFYPELRAIQDAPPVSSNTFDILVLGGSVLADEYGRIVPRLEQDLRAITPRPFRLFNAAASSHTTRDNYYNYRYLRNRHFDLVILYEGINDLRFNNCPKKMFHGDYSQDFWHHTLSVYHAFPRINALSFPFFIHYAWMRIGGQFLHVYEYMPTTRLSREWRKFGLEENKVAKPFRENIENNLNLAREKQEAVLLLTYAYYIPTNYSIGYFGVKHLDYQAHLFPVEFWGDPAFIGPALRECNRTVEALAKDYQMPFFDMAAQIPGEGRYFDDVCHLSGDGCDLFARRLAPVIAGLMGSREPPNNEAGTP